MLKGHFLSQYGATSQCLSSKAVLNLNHCPASVISGEIGGWGKEGVRVIWFNLQAESLERPQSKAATGTASPDHKITSLKANRALQLFRKQAYVSSSREHDDQGGISARGM